MLQMSSYKDPPLLVFERLSDAPVRIDWLGDVVTAFPRGKRAQFIKVACSKWEAFTSWGGAQYEEPQLEALVPIGFLRRLRVGDVWHEGYRVGGARLTQKSFAGLRVDQTTAEIVPCGDASICSDGISRHDLPFTHFVGHKAHTISHVVKVRVNPNTSLVVPCTELVRRYFGGSGSLARKVFSGALAERTLYDADSTEFRPVGRVASLRLGEDLTYHAASTVARIAFDPAARRAFKGLVNSGVAATANKKPWYAKMNFPIEGLTDLSVRGLWLERGPDRSFLALQILSCSHPFPFEKLFFELHPAQSAGSSARASDLQGAADEHNGAGARNGGGRGLDVGHANQNLSPLILDAETEPSDPFPDLATKKMHQVRKEPRPAAGESAQSQPSEQPHAPVGSPHLKEAPRGVEFVAARRLYRGGQPEPKSLLWLREEIAYSLPEVQAKAPFDTSVASRHLITHGSGFARRSSPIWATVFRYEAAEGVGRSFLCTVVESPASPQSIELLMFDIPSPQALDLEMFNRLVLMHFVPADRLLAAASGTEFKIGWTADRLAERDGTDLAVEMVEMMLDAFNHSAARAAGRQTRGAK
ncbi:hypothetical protein LJR161_000302 [Variovorax paradoxus]|uniref:hypothetical protein n=1 Tax=Variovorax paradoxus TaxID=34073 RepID=UPI003ED0F6E1